MWYGDTSRQRPKKINYWSCWSWDLTWSTMPHCFTYFLCFLLCTILYTYTYILVHKHTHILLRFTIPNKAWSFVLKMKLQWPFRGCCQLFGPVCSSQSWTQYSCWNFGRKKNLNTDNFNLQPRLHSLPLYFVNISFLMSILTWQLCIGTKFLRFFG